MDKYTVNVVPGAGAVARWQAGVVVVGGDQTAALDLAGEIHAIVGASPTAAALIEMFRSPRCTTGGANVAAAVSTPDGLRVFVCGAMQIRTETDQVIAGPEPVALNLKDMGALWMGAGDPPSEPPHAAVDLRRGVVMGESAVIYRQAAPQAVAAGVPTQDVVPAQVPPAALPDEPTASQEHVVEPFESIDWQGSNEPPARQPLEIAASTDASPASPAGDEVLGIRCSRGHFNNPKAGYCQVCGISMVHITHRLEPGPRPTLGFVVFSDGATYAVDRPYLIGREPQPSLDSGMAALATQDVSQSVSREHAKLTLDGWDVIYTDIGSTNGSFVWNVSARRWDPILPNVPVVLASGCTISVGRMSFVFEGASRPVTS